MALRTITSTDFRRKILDYDPVIIATIQEFWKEKGKAELPRSIKDKVSD